MRILVVGGAGYVGSHAAKFLAECDHEVWVYDNLSTGHADAVYNKRLIQAELNDRTSLEMALQEYRIEAVMHFAAKSLVGESVEKPDIYFHNNVVGTFELLEAMRRQNVRKIIFSSTAAVYGTPQEVPIPESAPKEPINPYGDTKLAAERMLTAYAQAYDFGVAALRYFNAAGAAVDGSIGEDHQPESHLIPIMLQVALGQRSHISIFGDDYDTPDGTCVRDYIHVEDLARAHLAALERIELGEAMMLNLGTGCGASVAEVHAACEQVTGQTIPAEKATRRPGDPPSLVAESQLAKERLSWQPHFVDIVSTVATAWEWHRRHPQGFEG